MIGGGDHDDAVRLARRLALPYPVAADKDGAVYRRYGLDKALLVIQRSATVLVDTHGIARYLQTATNPNASLDEQALLAAVDDIGS